jgi:phenylacetate-CoA ligase
MSLMDVARGAYARSPRGVRRTLAPLISLLPTRAKFGANYRAWRERIAHAAHDPAYASAEHLAALRALIAKAHAGSPFYRQLIDTSFGPGYALDTFTPADLRRLPILRKEDIRRAGDSMLAVPRLQVDQGDTSGSNGEKPLSFYLDKDRSGREMAFVFDTWSRAGFREDEAKVVLRGVGLDNTGQVLSEWEPALRELRLSAFPLSREHVSLYLDLIDRHEVRYLYGYPSAIEVMCRHMHSLGRRPKLPLLGVLPISEPLYPHQRRTITAALGDVPIAHFYGLSEKVLFADELSGSDGVYAFNPLYGLAELVDDNGQTITEPGREGRLIGTGFLSTGMPFIRSDTEDRARLVELPTEANGQRLQLSDLTPRRKPGFLIANDGSRLVTVDFTPESPRFFKGIEEYQFYQDAPGQCVIRYIPSEDGTRQDALNIAADLKRRSHDRIEFLVEQVSSLGSGRAGKRAFIDQRLDISLY